MRYPEEEQMQHMFRKMLDSGEPISKITATQVDRRGFLRIVGLGAAAGALTPLLSACGEVDDDDPVVDDAPDDDEPVDEPDDEDDEEPAEEPDDEEPAVSPDEPIDLDDVGEGVVIFGSAVDIPNIDPAVGHDGAIAETQKSLYDTLYRHSGNPPETIPWLATGHEVTEDAMEWTFTLDEDAAFQDGSPVTADAVVFSLERLLDVNQGVAWMFSGVMDADGVEAVDDHTVTFTLDTPFAPFLHATTWLFVVNPAVVEEHEEDGDNATGWMVENSAGSGPFIIRRWEPGAIYEFESDPDYWRGWDGPRLQGYIRQVMRESSTKRLALENGEIHAGDWISVDDTRLLEDHDEVIVPEEPTIGTYTIKMNHQRGPTSDIHVRRALSYAFDYDAMLQVMEGRATRLHGPVAETVPGAHPNLDYFVHDMERAAEELAQSEEWADGFEIEYAHVTGLEEQRQTGLILLDKLAELNIEVTITPMEWANAVAMFDDPEESPLLFPIYSGTDYPDPDNFLWQSFHSTSAGTWMGANHYDNPEMDELLESARATPDEEEREQIYHQIQELAVEDATEIFIFSEVGGIIHRQEIQGYEFTPVMGSNIFWYQIYLE
jgi:peptide/nickel transport system substrate-binding protein